MAGIRNGGPLPILLKPGHLIWVVFEEDARFGQRKYKFFDMPAMKKM